MNWTAFGGLLVMVSALVGLIWYRWVQDTKGPK